MARLAHYFLRFHDGNLFVKWEERQQMLASLFDNVQTICPSIGKDTNRRKLKFQIRHLNLNRSIWVIRLANDKVKQIERDFEVHNVKHEPSCFVIFDNRDHCRRVLIQRVRGAFGSTQRVKDILVRMLNENNLDVELIPQMLTREFYELWFEQQLSMSCIRFLGPPDQLAGEVLQGGPADSISAAALELFMGAKYQSKYQCVLEVRPALGEKGFPFDRESAYIRSLANVCAMTSTPIELVMSDGRSFQCFIDADEESERIQMSDFDTKWLKALFDETGEHRQEAEEHLVRYMNGLKYVVDDRERPVSVGQMPSEPEDPLLKRRLEEQAAADNWPEELERPVGRVAEQAMEENWPEELERPASEEA